MKKQKCLTHLLRELTQSAEKSPAFASGVFLRKSKRLLKEMLLLKLAIGMQSEAG